MVETNAEWALKLAEMEEWYRVFLQDPDKAKKLIEYEYAPYIEFFSKLTGRVLDVGGGAGFVARYLRPSCSYVVLDPSSLWISSEWETFGRNFRGEAVSMEHIVGVAEDMPFADSSFEAVISMWSLNHTQDWLQCVREMCRVAKPGAHILLVLEDMEPSWMDIAISAWQGVTMRVGLCKEAIRFHNEKLGPEFGIGKVLRAKISSEAWPVQEDHLFIEERQLAYETRACLKLSRRHWKGGFLALEYRKPD